MASDGKTPAVRGWLSDPQTHQEWVRTYYGQENLKFHELAIDYIIDVSHPKANSLFLDAGCGDCIHSIQLAKRGFSVQAVDNSEAVLDMARTTVNELKLSSQIRIELGDLTHLRFEDETFDNVLCWGVLMHIPSPGLGKAIHEITRVLRKDGALIISENNMGAPESLFRRNLARLLRGKHTEVKIAPAGVEYWTRKASGSSFLREANLSWIFRQFEEQGLVVQERVSGEFTSVWTMVPFHRVKNLILRFNRFWFKIVRAPHLAQGNLIIFRKPDTRRFLS